MKMPFGMHKGVELVELPDAYLDWLLSIELKPYLFKAVVDELSRRKRHAGSRSPRSPEPSLIAVRVAAVDVPIFRELVDRGYRALAKIHHPDAGGSTALMQQVNALADSLKGQLTAIEGRA